MIRRSRKIFRLQHALFSVLGRVFYPVKLSPNKLLVKTRHEYCLPVSTSVRTMMRAYIMQFLASPAWISMPGLETFHVSALNYRVSTSPFSWLAFSIHDQAAKLSASSPAHTSLAENILGRSRRPRPCWAYKTQLQFNAIDTIRKPISIFAFRKAQASPWLEAHSIRGDTTDIPP